MQLEEILKEMIENNASDIFIIAGLELAYKKGGQHFRTNSNRLMPADTFDLIRQIYGLARRDFKHFTDNDQHDDDFSFSIPGLGRFRANAFRQRGSAGAVIRIIPFGLPDPVENNIPEEVLSLSRFKKGLVLVTGSAGAGKSTTLACIIDRLNHERSGHIVTMEDPIEYVHRHGTCIVTQREIPTDVATYSEALRSAIRESPDVILLGEMRDQDTMATAVTAAEMSQLIFSTMHTSSASTTVDRIVDSFPSIQQRQIRMQLSLVLRAVISQQLVPTIDGGVTPAFEIMVANTAIRNLIREEKTYQIDSVVASSSKHGMRTMDQSLFDLVKDGKVNRDVALQHAIHPEALQNRLNSVGL
ncbi:MAG: PilT/PilU family type 4a pilus ATPase [Atopobiaceae bacterium]|nr:PilT/PilU family type 4a pilus ATPase [Atopobiaceae bacterium]